MSCIGMFAGGGCSLSTLSVLVSQAAEQQNAEECIAVRFHPIPEWWTYSMPPCLIDAGMSCYSIRSPSILEHPGPSTDG